MGKIFDNVLHYYVLECILYYDIDSGLWTGLWDHLNGKVTVILILIMIVILSLVVVLNMIIINIRIIVMILMVISTISSLENTLRYLHSFC